MHRPATPIPAPPKKNVVSTNRSTGIPWFLALTPVLIALLFSGCSVLNALPPEVNLMQLDVQDVTLSHVNLQVDLRLFNPNAQEITIQGVEYTLHMEGIKIFSGKSYMRQTVAPQEYEYVTLRLASVY